MNSPVSLYNLKINKGDPRQSQSFLDLSWFIKETANKFMSDDEWRSLDRRCQKHLRNYGYDLQSGCWFCLLSLRLRGWKGLAKALDILVFYWRDRSVKHCWPSITATDQRRYLLEWLDAHVVTGIYLLDDSAELFDGVGKTAENIAYLYQEAVKAEARCINSLKNLHYFLQVRSRVPVRQVLKPAPDETVAESVSLDDSANLKDVKPAGLSRTEKRRLVKIGTVGLLCGIVVTVLVMSAVRYIQKPSLSQQILGTLNTMPEYEAISGAAWKSTKKEKLDSQRDEILQQSALLLQWISERPGDELLR